MPYIHFMKQYSGLIIGVLMAATPGLADDHEDNMRDGVELLQEGTRLLLEGLMLEIGPALQELKNGLIDLNAYHPPEVLPNGDIIIRRKTDAEMERDSEGDIDL
jgi:hypothetical protein